MPSLLKPSTAGAHYDPKRLESLDYRSHRPKQVRPPTYSLEIIEAVLRLRIEEYPRWRKAKLAMLLRHEGFTFSVSTVGRILNKPEERRVLKKPLPDHIPTKRS